MSGPWDKYKTQEAAPAEQAEGPWSKYQAPKAEEKPEEESTLRQLARTSIDTVLPVAGAIGGGLLATPGSFGLGTIPGGALGYAAGKQGARILKNQLLGDPYEETDATGLAKQTVGDVGEGVIAESGGLALGKVVEAAAPLVSKATKPVGEKIMSAADSLAARALGAERATVKKLGNEKIKKVGRYALDNDLLKSFSNTDDVIAANQAVQERGGKMMNEVYTKIDDSGQKLFDPLQVATNVDEKIGGFYRSPINRGETNQLENTLESILIRGDKPISLKEAQALKQELGKVANWQNKLQITDKEKMARDAYGVVSKEIDAATDVGSKNIGSDDLLSLLGQGKKFFSNSEVADELLTNKSAREQGNKIMGLTDWGVVGGGIPAAIISGGTSVLPTVGLLGAKKYAEKYGAQQGALLFNKAGKALTKSIAAPAVQTTSNVVKGAFVKDAGELKGIDRWIAKGQERVVETDSSIDPEYLRELQKSKKGKDMLIRAGELSPKSSRMNEVVEQIKNSEEYKQFLKEKEKSAQGKEPDQSSVKPQPKMKFPMVVKKDGYTAVVRNADELTEAKGEGWA